jgi:hypothetical protein
MNITFKENSWSTDNLAYAYSRRFDAVPVFTQYPDHIENRGDPSVPYGFENISLLTRDRFTAGTRVTTRCAFFDDGAPLITLARSMEPDARGVLRFGEYIEIVLYKNGVNVWRMWYDPAVTKNGGVSWKKLMGVEFPVTAGEIHTLSCKVGTESLIIEADGRRMSLYIPDLYPSFHAGIDACEGVNRFYSFDVEPD